ncbi:MAG: serine O-acetyltransferase, partial [Clostridium sp.]
MIIKDIWQDVKAVQERDPAARNAAEVLLLYQGVHALIWHRFAHWFYEHHMFFVARLISQLARFCTLIEIHPGAQLGHGILIDHGSGVVIGETAVVGDNCTIYQGVTLGGVGTQKGKRHPTLGNNVTVGAGAKILGSFEVGDNCSIAANAVLLRQLDENSTAVGIPARAVKKDGISLPKREKMILGEHDRQLLEQIEELRNQVSELSSELEKL